MPAVAIESLCGDRDRPKKWQDVGKGEIGETGWQRVIRERYYNITASRTPFKDLWFVSERRIYAILSEGKDKYIVILDLKCYRDLYSILKIENRENGCWSRYLLDRSANIELELSIFCFPPRPFFFLFFFLLLFLTLLLSSFWTSRGPFNTLLSS